MIDKFGLKFEHSVDDVEKSWTSPLAWLSKLQSLGSGSAGKEVASDIRGPQFETSHEQNQFLLTILTVNCIEKRKIKSDREWPIFNNLQSYIPASFTDKEVF